MKSKAGRPTVVTPDALLKLEAAFLMGCTDVEACLYADISPTALYGYQDKNPEYAQRKDMLKQNPFMRARNVLLTALDKGDVATAHKVLDRKEGSKIAVVADVKVTGIERTIVHP